MTITRISEHLFQVTWKELIPYETNTIVYFGKHCTLIIDTFLGPSKMNNMMHSLPAIPEQKPLVIVNTHYHFDHVWGNSAFPSSTRIATSLCREKIIEHAESDKLLQSCYWEKNNQVCLPNLLISASIHLPDESIDIFPSPGHTEDSCSVFFYREKILAAGDNIEKPIPYLENKNWDAYLQTLTYYQSLKPALIIPGHGKADYSDIESTIQYIHAWCNQSFSQYRKAPYQTVHEENTKVLSSLFHTSTE